MDGDFRRGTEKTPMEEVAQGRMLKDGPSWIGSQGGDGMH